MLKGVTYFRRWGFSINEGEFPNVHASWRSDTFFFYVAIWLFRPFRLYFNIPLRRHK
ncbi:hypothetical protein [Bradyrhizobium pachyrhizi]|uniref:hypothetical protein n=1 Tax=Bradyrhizobium pachyrhizi TaxID=280333 RepID=UPI000AD36950|nr:hypothetical protein [Bradyrhizobium pachyrhizi]